MNKEELYYVIVVPQNEGDFNPLVIEYGISLKSAENVVRRYINDHGMRFKKNGKKYPSFVRIMRISEPLPEDYYLLTLKEIVEV